MKKLVFAFLMTVAVFFLNSAMDSPIASAEDVWAYTSDSGSEYYVQTEGIRLWGYSSLTGNIYAINPKDIGYYDQVGLQVDVRVIRPGTDRAIYPTYHFIYYTDTGVWICQMLGKWPLQNEEHPEFYAIWEVAREYL